MSLQAKYQDVVLKSQTEVVYLEYRPEQLPPKPSADQDGAQWTRFVCISDTHSKTFEVPDGDVLLHSGDLTDGKEAHFKQTMDWLYELPHPVKIIIAGNHDLPLHTEWYERQHDRHARSGKEDTQRIIEMLKGAEAQQAGIVYLQDEKHEFKVHENGKLWSVYGSPVEYLVYILGASPPDKCDFQWSPRFGNWAFGYGREAAEEIVSQFPKTDILLTHGPAREIFDRNMIGSDVGCDALRARLSELRPRLHVFGHIHEAHGAYIHKWDPADNFAPPTVQNHDLVNLATSNTAVGSESTLVEGRGDHEDVELERTVFVNAANSSKGPLAMRGGVRSAFGGPGFQAVVVDLKERPDYLWFFPVFSCGQSLSRLDWV
ncbi:hypothetical protein M413DRAFT_145993 [Hebeloma cylindrosporum]|uniref:Calcineurin-like phosphoesterase domain-containing protein n=1 Tax=Hebeloma cylindrosporum TaxID=76867 RepID=A0A0C3CAR0_HEBCY|nr:hypothetical protein M413DRAFT_145993 [Hebeloma cylindrosporum h7]